MNAPGVTQFKTHDLYFAAFLHAAGVPLTGTEPDAAVRVGERARVLFVFDSSVGTTVHDLKNAYFSQGPMSRLPALQLKNSIQTLKAMVHM